MSLIGRCTLGTVTVTLALLVCACTATGSRRGAGTITIESTPAGATVLADGIEIGTTPLAFKPGDAFRSGITSGTSGLLEYRYQGRLALKKAGCRDYVTAVDDHLLAQDISVALQCAPDHGPPGGISAPHHEHGADAAQRLMRIRSLHEKGLISDEEYQSLRQRVLDTL